MGAFAFKDRIQLPLQGRGVGLTTEGLLAGDELIDTFQGFHIPVQVNAPWASTEELLSAIGAVRAEISEVKGLLERQQELLEQILAHTNGVEIQVDDVSNDEARTRILELFRNSAGPLFYDDLAERLRLPLRQTVEICNQLETEGLIGERKP